MNHTKNSSSFKTSSMVVNFILEIFIFTRSLRHVVFIWQQNPALTIAVKGNKEIYHLKEKPRSLKFMLSRFPLDAIAEIANLKRKDRWQRIDHWQT